MLLLIVGIIILIPIHIESSPEISIRILDSENKPVSSAYVKRSWIHCSAEDESHSDETYTNKDGYAYFSRKYANASIASVISRAINNIISLGIHASFNATTTLVAIKDDYEGFAYYDSTHQPEKEIILHKRLGPPLVLK
jgi:hypothetical protein